MLQRHRSILLRCIASGLLLAAPIAFAQGVDVSVRITRHGSSNEKSTPPSKHGQHETPADLVVWLTPLQADTARVTTVSHPGPFRLVQRDKQFTPHLLVVPTGSSVEFPNQDPFFHNVFSLFNGKRFDLGLYESGTTRSVRFDREGVSYIFCNIHPEMGAIVLSLSTPFYAVTSTASEVTIHNVPPGSYRLGVWTETSPASTDPPRVVQVAAAPLRIEETITQHPADTTHQHKNKFGEDYRPSHNPAY